MMKSMKNMSREERAEFLRSHKSELTDSSLERVNGGAARCCLENADSSENPFNEIYYTSNGFVCDGEVIC